jgi:hypothetical protein
MARSLERGGSGVLLAITRSESGVVIRVIRRVRSLYHGRLAASDLPQGVLSGRTLSLRGAAEPGGIERRRSFYV